MAETVEPKYSAFLSYSHHDSTWAKWLHAGLEGTRIDKDLVGRETPAGPVPRSLRPIFRDRDDFAAGPSLTEQTLAALQASKFLVVLCSPHAANSQYVDEEIRRFTTMGRGHRIIAVIVEGEPGDPERECFPPALRYKVGPDGTLTEDRQEPIAADARPQGDGKEMARQKVVAGLLGVGLDEIVHRAERARRRHARIRDAIIAALVVLTLASGAGFVWARYELGRNEALLDRTLQRATALVNSAVQLSEQFRVPRTVSLGILEQAEGLFRDMSELGRETMQLRHRKAVMLIEFARNYAILGNTQARETRATDAQQLMAALVAEQPDNLSWQSDLSAAETELGNALVAKGKLPEALARYRASLAIRQRLTVADPRNVDWQFSLADIYRAVGIVLATQGKSAEALDSYRASLTITERLALADPSKLPLKQDIALDHFRIGDVLRQLGKLAEALQEFQTSVDIRQQLALADPDNANWQLSLSWSHSRIGDVFADQNKLADALESHRAALVIRERVAAADRTNAEWQHDLLWGYTRVGDVLRVQRKFPEAEDNYRQALAIAARLADSDPSNGAAKVELSIHYMKIGDLRRAQLNFADALDNYRTSLTLLQRVVADDPSNGIWRCHVTMRSIRIGGMLLEQGKTAEALQSFRDSLEIMQQLSLTDPDNALWQGQLALTHELIGDAFRAQGKVTEAIDSYRASSTIRERLAATHPDNPFWQRELTAVESKIEGALGSSPVEGWAAQRFGSRLVPATCGTPASTSGTI